MSSLNLKKHQRGAKKQRLEYQLKIENAQECFTHYDGDNDIYRTFMIGTMNHFVADYPFSPMLVRKQIEITPEIVDYTRKQCGIEQARVDRMKEPYLSKPIIAILWPDKPSDGVTVVDGNHRIVRLWDMGVRKVNTVIFHPDLWKHLILPPDAQKRFLAHEGLNADNLHAKDSGILAFENGEGKWAPLLKK